jgi:hypothetical protein
MKFFVRVENEIEKLAVLVKFEAWGIRWGSGNEKATDFTAFYVPAGILYNYFNKKEIHYGMENGIPEANILDFLKAEKIEDVLPVFEVSEDCKYFHKEIATPHSCTKKKGYRLILSETSTRRCHNCPDYEKKKKVVRYYQRAGVNKDGEGYIFFKNDKRQILYAKSDLDVSTAYDTKVCPTTHRIYIDCEVAE